MVGISRLLLAVAGCAGATRTLPQLPLGSRLSQRDIDQWERNHAKFTMRKGTVPKPSSKHA
jgi:hypothetical protein